jgi:hypothetical protein
MKPPLKQRLEIRVVQIEQVVTHGGNGMRFNEWKWLIGPDPLPIFLLVLMPASM